MLLFYIILNVVQLNHTVVLMLSYIYAVYYFNPQF